MGADVDIPASGLKPEILQKNLGHADYNTTVGVYAHLDKEEILAEASKLTVTDTRKAIRIKQSKKFRKRKKDP